MTLEVHIDRELCMGSGNCAYYAPGAFDIDDDGVAIVVDVKAAPEDNVLLAAEKCPTHAITVTVTPPD